MLSKGVDKLSPVAFPFDTEGGSQLLQCWNTEGLFCLIQSIQRGVKEQREYAILTAEISQAGFGLTPAEYARHKKLDRQNLRDHRTDLELIFSMLGEASTTEIVCSLDTRGFDENKHVARQGGSVAGRARKELEKKTGRKVVSSDNYLALTPAKLKRKSPTRKQLKSN